MVKKMMKKEEGKLKTNVSDLGTVSTALATVLAEQIHASPKTAKVLKDAYRAITRMYNQKQGT